MSGRMRGAGSSTRWWLGACCVAALLLALSALLLLRRSRARAAAQAQGAAACAVPAQLPLRALPEEEYAPVLAAAEAGVDLRIDGEPVHSARLLPAGEHTVRAQAAGAQALEWRLRFDAYTPALLHAQADAHAGLTLVALGAVCSSCPAPLRPESLAPQRSGTPPAALLSGAAQQLRSGDWVHAAEALRGVTGKAREGALYLRLAAAVHAASLQPDVARRTLEALPRREAGALPRLLRAFDARTVEETRRRSAVTLARWNRVTERYSALVQRFESQVPAPATCAGKRLEALSSSFEMAALVEDDVGMERALAAAEAALGTLVAQVRGARPHDCAFQAEVVATVSR